MTTTLERIQEEALEAPCCVYCDMEMQALLRDTVTVPSATNFTCTVCGWEVRVPHQ